MDKTFIIKLVSNQHENISKDAKTLAIEYSGKKTLYFPAAGCIVKAVKDVNNELLFSLVNRYFSDISEQEQEQLYAFYDSSINIIKSDMHKERTVQRLVTLINSHSKIFDIDRISYWLERLPNDPASYKSIIDVYPEDSADSHMVDKNGTVGEFINRPGTKTKTLLRDEVRDMISLTIISKIIAPIICQYVYKFKPIFLKFIELALFDILSGLTIFKHPIISRIYEYINAFIVNDKVHEKLSLVVHRYMSDDEYPDYIISLLFTSRLMNATLMPGEGKRSFIPNVVNLCVTDATEPSRLFSESELRNKSADTGSKDPNDQERSEFDRIGVGFTLSPGQQIMAEWGVTKFVERELFQAECPHRRLTVYDPELIDKYLELDRSKVLNQPCQRAICGIVVNEFFPRTMFNYVSNKPDTQLMNKLYLISAIWLEQNGFPNVAKMQVANGAVDDHYIIGVELHNFSESDIRKLEGIYPSKMEMHLKNQKLHAPNLGVTLIDKIVKGFVSLRWSDNSGRTVEPPANFRQQLVDIILKRGI